MLDPILSLQIFLKFCIVLDYRQLSFSQNRWFLLQLSQARMHCSQNLSKRFSWSLAGRWESANISVRSYLLLIPKHSVTHMRGLVVLVSFARDLAGPRFFLHGISGKLCGSLYIFSAVFTSFSVLLLFTVLITFFCVYAQFLMLIHVTKMRFS